ncbi:cupin domain-containing protein [Candidatus Woesearchaeota archaeon]|nr:cupin domain-containing protein [Candidatus Woesearchaeota archaeon]
MLNMKESEKFKEEQIRLLAGFKGERHEHLWGHELWIENNEKYCNKLLILHKGFESSWHYHERKDETFVILEGQVSLTYANGPNAPRQTLILDKGGKFRLKPGVIHSFKSLVPKSTVMEISTTDDGDNIKLRPARKID